MTAEARAHEQLGLRKPAKERARQLQGKLDVMGACRELAGALFRCQEELRQLVTREHRPLSARDVKVSHNGVLLRRRARQLPATAPQ
eukprot:COSAG01_NODE_251_length_20305_cov_5.846447_11_plen_87_part_00